MMEVDLAEVELDLVRAFGLAELREVNLVEPRRAFELGAARLVPLRLAVQVGRVLAQRFSISASARA